MVNEENTLWVRLPAPLPFHRVQIDPVPLRTVMRVVAGLPDAEIYIPLLVVPHDFGRYELHRVICMSGEGLPGNRLTAGVEKLTGDRIGLNQPSSRSDEDVRVLPAEELLRLQ